MRFKRQARVRASRLVWPLAGVVGCTPNAPVLEGPPVAPTELATPTPPTPTPSTPTTDPVFTWPSSRFFVSITPTSPVGPFAEVSGRYQDAPDVRFHLETDREGQCRLMTYTPSTCEPACEAGVAQCVEAECIAYPVREDRGPIVLSSLQTEQTITVQGTGEYNGFVELNAPKDPVQLTLPEGTFGFTPFDSPDPALTTGWELEHRDGDGVIRWTNTVPGTRVLVHMSDCDASHGAVAANEIECDGPDVGEVTIPARFLEELDAGNWGRENCGFAQIIRYAPRGDANVSVHFRALGWFNYFPGNNIPPDLEP